MKLLLIEDNDPKQATLQRSFDGQGIHVTPSGDGVRALDRCRASLPDAVLLDLSLPGRDGLKVLTDARAEGLATPVITRTAHGTVGDRVLGLNTGVDDYLPKPFDLDELEARVRALARPDRPGGAGSGGAARSPGGGAGAGAGGLLEGCFQPPSFCGLRPDADSGAVYHQGQPLELAPREGALLRALLNRPGQAVAEERLFDLVFEGEPELQPDAIEVVAYRLRKKLAATAARLVTLRRLGSLLKADG